MKTANRYPCFFLIVAAVCLSYGRPGLPPPTTPGKLVPAPIGKLDHPRLEEASGLQPSLRFPGLYWSHNDGGHGPWLFAHTRTGETVAAPVKLAGAQNIDWEDMTMDDQGRLWVADVGNNNNKRRDMAIYVVDEPLTLDFLEGWQATYPSADYAIGAPVTLPVIKRLPVHYPEQTAFPPPDNNYDCEAVFWSQGKLYLMTKHRADRDTMLYRMDTYHEDRSNALTRLAIFPIDGEVTAADISPDGSQIAVLCYRKVLLFARPEGSDNFLSGVRHERAFTGKQAEAICFTQKETLLITNEQRDIFEIPLTAFEP